jgi:outer membrane receptor protein involved in Fe transport
VRGAFASPAITPITRAIGEELGARARLFDRWDLATAFWMLDLANETVWNGDDGTTSVSGATNRKGIEFETRFELTKWLVADLDVTFTSSAFTANHGNGSGLALAPKETWSGGLSARHKLGPGVIRAGFRFFGIGDRPASDDGAITVPGWTQFDLHVGYKHRRFDVALDIENLFDAKFPSAAFDTTSRLRTDPAMGAPIPPGFTCGPNARVVSAAGRFGGCEGLDFTPAYPFTARLTGTFYLD